MFAAADLTSAFSVFGPLEQATRSRDVDQVLFPGGMPTADKVFPAYVSGQSPRVVTFPATLASSGAGGAGGGPVPASFDRQGNPRTVEQAVAWMQAAVPRGVAGSRYGVRASGT